MAHGVRKLPLERLQDELTEVRDSITQHESYLETLKEREKSIQNQIGLEEFKEFKPMLNEQEMTVDDTRELVSAQNEIQQSAQ